LKEIKLDTTIADLLNNYDGMKDTLISINPKFKKLNNPILRRTLAKLATVKQAAIIGGMEPIDLLNKLRRSVGQEAITKITKEDNKENIEPEWINLPVLKELNANEILDADKNPLAEVNKALKELDGNNLIKLISDFQPEPLIEEFAKKGHKVYCKEINSKYYETYII